MMNICYSSSRQSNSLILAPPPLTKISGGKNIFYQYFKERNKRGAFFPAAPCKQKKSRLSSAENTAEWNTQEKIET